MTTSRTGTGEWIRRRNKTLRQAQADGLTHCPECKVELNYIKGKTPSSAEADHIVSWSAGGDNSLDNLRVICRRCNQSLGAKKNMTSKPAKERFENIDFTILPSKYS